MAASNYQPLNDNNIIVEVVSNERIVEDYPEIKNVPVYDVKEGTIDICLGQNHFCYRQKILSGAKKSLPVHLLDKTIVLTA